jgi:hypothetical protein
MHKPHVLLMEEPHVPKVLVNHSPKNNGTLHLLVSYVRQLVLRVGQSKMPIQTQNSPLCQQALVSGHVLTGSFLLL